MNSATRVYVAGHFNRHDECRTLIDEIKDAGYAVTHDWTRGDDFKSDGSLCEPTPSIRRKIAEDDLVGAASADVLILLGHKGMVGAFIEMGAALARGKRVIVVAPQFHSVFLSLPNVQVVTTEAAAIVALERIATANQCGCATNVLAAHPDSGDGEREESGATQDRAKPVNKTDDKEQG